MWHVTWEKEVFVERDAQDLGGFVHKNLPAVFEGKNQASGELHALQRLIVTEVCAIWSGAKVLMAWLWDQVGVCSCLGPLFSCTGNESHIALVGSDGAFHGLRDVVSSCNESGPDDGQVWFGEVLFWAEKGALMGEAI